MKKLRSELNRAATALGRRPQAMAATDRVSSAQSLLSRWAAEIDSVCEDESTCGPSMVIPFA